MHAGRSWKTAGAEGDRDERVMATTKRPPERALGGRPTTSSPGHVPPGEAVKGVPSPISLAVVPGVVDPLQVSFEGVFRIGNCVWSRAFFARGGRIDWSILVIPRRIAARWIVRSS
jgi:hypothetical protein